MTKPRSLRRSNTSENPRLKIMLFRYNESHTQNEKNSSQWANRRLWLDVLRPGNLTLKISQDSKTFGGVYLNRLIVQAYKD